MSHEWDCRCKRCADDDLHVTLDDDEAENRDSERDELRYGSHDAD